MEILKHLSHVLIGNEKSDFTFEDAMAFVGAEYALAA